ncbi:DUF4129 domain-containing protein [Maribacter aestuarii]|uniref:DUF4129 domain-containing protein n=1 Tax=Maribacter aestuarii TaxID=1130723 RepID=UPI0025A68AE2|nr:DUF4129 domain-containing protein [Maribacter aestuarii]
MLYRLKFLLIFSLFCKTMVAQNDTISVKLDTASLIQKTIDERELETFRENPDFNYEVAKNSAPEWWIAFKNWLSNLIIQFFEWLFGVEQAVGAFNTFLKVLPYLLLLILVFILIKFFINVNARAVSFNKKNQALVTLSEEEHIIKNEDVQKLIQQALEEKNYRLAIRYYYLYILRLLNEKELISWELQKTNADYNRELEKTVLNKPFAQITRLYEYIWYGDFPIDESTYRKAEINFSSLKVAVQNG